ncbi:MAG: PEP-CTERM sorting domain-containing protein [Alteromonadaceae bacterium]|nr:PEP-CTERM sorting domain-containing protein [Alteromonadaceae bacterium]
MSFIKKLLIALTILPSLTQAALITSYTDRTSFVAALGGLATIEEDFNGLSESLFTSAFDLNLGDFSIASNDVAGDSIGVRDLVTTNGSYFTPTHPENDSVDGTRFFGINGSSGGPSFTVSFSTERFVFGFDWLDGDVTDSYAMSVLGEVFENPPFDNTWDENSQYRGFFGIVSDTAFTEISFYQTDAGGTIAGFGIDNLITSQVNIVTCAENPSLPECVTPDLPEPSALALLSLGLIGLYIRRKKQL